MCKKLSDLFGKSGVSKESMAENDNIWNIGIITFHNIFEVAEFEDSIDIKRQGANVREQIRSDIYFSAFFNFIELVVDT